MKKKLLLISPMLHQGGFERVCVRTARILEPFYDITIAIFDSADIAFNIEGLHVVDLHLGVRKGKLQKLLNIFKRARALKKLKKQLGTEISYSFGQTANLANVFAKAGDRVLCGIRSYQDFDDPKVMKLFVRRADEIVCCSRDMEKEIRERFGAKNIYTINNPVNLERTKKEAGAAGNHNGSIYANPVKSGSESSIISAKDAPILEKLKTFREDHPDLIVSMGRDDDIKGYWHLVKATAMLRSESFDKAGLVILGEGSYTPLKKLAADLGIAEHCLFPGVLKEPFTFLSTGKVYALTSLKEGFPNSLVEAMAAGVPVVATNCKTGPEEILIPEDADMHRPDHAACGLLIPPLEGDINLNADEIQDGDRKLRDALAAVLADESLRNDLKLRGKLRAAEFSDEAYVKACMMHFG